MANIKRAQKHFDGLQSSEGTKVCASKLFLISIVGLIMFPLLGLGPPIGEGMGRNPPREPSAGWWMSHVYEFLVLGHVGFLTMFSFTILRAVVMK